MSGSSAKEMAILIREADTDEERAELIEAALRAPWDEIDALRARALAAESSLAAAVGALEIIASDPVSNAGQVARSALAQIRGKDPAGPRGDAE